MCTLIVLHRCIPGKPLVVAANRDEFLDRPAEGPALRRLGRGRILAPLDLEAGGTWLGLNARGVFAGLTNLRPVEDLAPDAFAVPEGGVRGSADRNGAPGRGARRSRGEVVMAALEAGSAAQAIRSMSDLEEEAYEPFQLLVADGHEAWLTVYRGRAHVHPLEAGLHVVGNVEDERIAAVLGTAGAGRATQEEPRARKLARIRGRVEKLMTEPDGDLFEGLARVCREHVENPDGDPDPDPGTGRRADRSPLESTCVHVANRYGTRSSLLLELSLESAANRLWTTDGPPCERPFENRSSLLEELGVRLSNRAGPETM
ncbi:MAG TPA: hypothetical protein ENI85_14465 [Deltaproteobacteria bacterium]|nr:hypothetical protein [Deltaproteobacteria bacterium]